MATFSALLALCGEFTGPRWTPHTKASDGELWCFLWSSREPTGEQTVETPVIWDTITLIVKSLSGVSDFFDRNKGYLPIIKFEFC